MEIATIKYLITADQELNSGLDNPNTAIEPTVILEYLAQLMQTGASSITNNKALVYLNLVNSGIC